MLYNLHNDRGFHLGRIFQIASGMNVWYRDSFILVGKGETGKANVSSILRGLMPNLGTPEEKSRKIREKTFKDSEIVSAVEKYEAANAGKVAKVYVGNHRAAGNVVCGALFGDAAEPQVIEIDPKDGSLASVESHAGNRLVSQLTYAETLNVVLPLIKNGHFAKQNDVRKMFGDGTGQKLWEHARLDAMGVAPDKYIQLSKEEARQAADAGANAESVVDSFISKHEANGKNTKKVLAGEPIRQLYGFAKGLDAEEKDAVTQLLAAIVNASEMTALAVIRDHFIKVAANAPAPETAPVTVAETKGKKVKAA